MENIKILAPTSPLKGNINLPSSKSIANRYLLIRAIANDSFTINNLSESDDTQVLSSALGANDEIYDVHHAGTCARFLCAYLSFKKGKQQLTGSSRMKQRPISDLVDALRQVGANIQYLEQEGHLPLAIESPSSFDNNKVKIKGNVSSQYLSALCMIAPSLPNGLIIEVDGYLVSRPYLDMTLEIMRGFGIHIEENQGTFTIASQHYNVHDVTVESDWSAASYYFGMVSLIPGSKLTLPGLYPKSLQGDSALPDLYDKLNIATSFVNGEVTIEHIDKALPPIFEYDFIGTPDLFQTVATTCAIHGITGVFTGLETLVHKETNRTKSLTFELGKVDVFLSKLPPSFSKKSDQIYYMLEGKAKLKSNLSFDAYNDHRMSMALSQMSVLGEIQMNDAHVVSKSYPNYWKDLDHLGWKRK